jgi:hypothetical protein
VRFLEFCLRAVGSHPTLFCPGLFCVLEASPIFAPGGIFCAERNAICPGLFPRESELRHMSRAGVTAICRGGRSGYGSIRKELEARVSEPKQQGQRSRPRQRDRACCTGTTLRSFCFRSRRRARIQPEAESTLGFTHRRWGDLHGRKLASTLMRSRLHNRTRDRGGEPIRLMEGGIAPGPSRTGPGALSQVLCTIVRFREVADGRSSKGSLG